MSATIIILPMSPVARLAVLPVGCEALKKLCEWQQQELHLAACRERPPPRTAPLLVINNDRK